MSDPSARRAVVTISALYGTGSSVTGGRVAAALAVPFLDRDAANTPPRTGRADHGGSDVDAPRTLRQRATAALGRASTMSGEVGGDVERLDVDERGLRGRTEELLTGAAVAGGVAIGRGGMVVLRTVPWALHVFLGGPREGRVAAGMASAGLDRHTAADLQRREDEARISYVRRAYGVDGEDPLLYHLMLDAVALGADTCVELIVTAARRRLANPQPTPPI